MACKRTASSEVQFKASVDSKILKKKHTHKREQVYEQQSLKINYFWRNLYKGFLNSHHILSEFEFISTTIRNNSLKEKRLQRRKKRREKEKGKSVLRPVHGEANLKKEEKTNKVSMLTEKLKVFYQWLCLRLLKRT